MSEVTIADASAPATGPAAVPGARRDAVAVDHDAVARIQGEVAARLAARLQTDPPLDSEGQRQYGRRLITEQVTAWADGAYRAGACTPAAEHAMAAAVFAAVFGLGRLQPLVDDPGIENIDVDGCEPTWLTYADGRLERGPSVADSDTELVELLQRLAARCGRSISTGHPRLHLALPGGARLAAMIATVPRPQVSIRRHRVRGLGLDNLTKTGSVSPEVAAFLKAAVAARKNVIVTGRQNAGKTTLVAALCHQIPPLERFATIEKEYELGLHQTDRHPRVVAMQAREGNSETTAAGRPRGQVDLSELIVDALRMNLQRLIVGEVRGDEAVPMLQAMSTGDGGSLCTLHARSAGQAIERLVTLCLGTGMSDQFAYRLVAGAIDFIVHLSLTDDTPTGGGLIRRVAEVIEIAGVGENGRPATNVVFAPDACGQAAPRHTPACLEELRRAGFDLDLVARS